jgi:hypothetical protein
VVTDVCEDADPSGGNRLTEEERQRILQRLHRALVWVGIRIPEEACLGGERVELKDLVDRFVFDDYIDEEERAEANALIDIIEDRAEILEEELEEKDLTLQEAEAIFKQFIGLLRAIDELAHLDDEEVWEDRRQNLLENVEEVKRWHDFAKKVYEKDEYH